MKNSEACLSNSSIKIRTYKGLFKAHKLMG